MELLDDVVSLAKLHEVMRHDPREGEEGRDFHTEFQTDGSVTVTAAHRPGEEVQLRGVNAEMLLHGILKHYPTEARVNGNDVTRSPWNQEGEVTLIYTEPE